MLSWWRNAREMGGEQGASPFIYSIAMQPGTRISFGINKVLSYLILRWDAEHSQASSSAGPTTHWESQGPVGEGPSSWSLRQPQDGCGSGGESRGWGRATWTLGRLEEGV